MIYNPIPFPGLNLRIPIIIPIQGKGFINHGTGVYKGYIGRMDNNMEVTI